MSGTIEEGIVEMPRRQEIARVEQPNGGALTPMDMVAQAVSQGATIEVLEKLMALQERWQAGQAKRAFDGAIAAAKAEIPPIVKNKTVAFEGRSGPRTSYRHETLDEVVRTIQPYLSKHGLDARFRSETAGNIITVICRISHKDGHAEETGVPAPADVSGSKNPIQAIGSTITYLQRYTLKLALGLAAAEDDDARSVSERREEAPLEASGPISAAQMVEIRELADRVGADIPRFCRYLKVNSIADIPAGKFDAAVAALKAKEAKR